MELRKLSSSIKSIKPVSKQGILFRMKKLKRGYVVYISEWANGDYMDWRSPFFKTRKQASKYTSDLLKSFI